MTSFLFVCLGNICRSPSAEAVMNHLIEERGLTGQFHCDSAGTSGWHVGERADSRMREHGAKRGFDLISISRKFDASTDFEKFDYILGMDNQNVWDIKEQDRKQKYGDKIFLMTDFCTRIQAEEVPDPYYGGSQGFERVMDLLEDACEGLLEKALADQG